SNHPASWLNTRRPARDTVDEDGRSYRDGAVRNSTAEAFTLVYLGSGGGERITTPFFQALGKLGIQGEYRRADFALIQKRLDVFDFDLFTIRIPGQEAPGAELMDRFSSQAADTEGSGNLIGIKDPAVDAILEQVVSATTHADQVARLRALDRVLRHNHYVVPQYFSSTFRIAYRAGKFEQPKVMPQYYTPEEWVIGTWWSKK